MLLYNDFRRFSPLVCEKLAFFLKSFVMIIFFMPWKKKLHKSWAPSVIYKNCPTKNIAQSAKIRPIWSPCSPFA
jgi:hypothetical protein